MKVHPLVVTLLALLLLLPGVVFAGLRLSTPVDASLPVVDFQETPENGLAVVPAAPTADGLQPGDVVVALNGTPVDDAIRGLISGGGMPALDGQVRYTVLRGGQTIQVAAPLQTFPLPVMLRQSWSIYFFLVYLLAVSALVFALRPRVASAQLFLLLSTVIASSALAYFPGLLITELASRWTALLYALGAVVLYGLLLAGLAHFSITFPTPLPAMAKRRGWRALIYLAVWVPLLIYVAVRWPASALPSARLAALLQGTTLMTVTYFPLVLLATYAKYQYSDAHQQRQARWLVWRLAISLAPYLVFSVVPSLIGLPEILPLPLLGILWCSVPTAFAIAILRERLFDIDVIIRRTLIYSALTLTLGAIYFVSILLLQSLFQVIVGQAQSPLATVLSTLIIAALFNPLRKSIQQDIDRRFYRHKYNAEQLLIEFAANVRNEVAIDRIADRLVEVVDEAVEPQFLSVWIPWK